MNRPLTPRELAVVELIGEGHITSSAANKLGVSFDTVKSRLQRASKLTGAQSQAHLVAICYRRGWLAVDPPAPEPEPPTPEEIIDESVELLRRRGPAADAVLARYAERVLRDRTILEHLENALRGNDVHGHLVQAVELLETSDPTGKRLLDAS